MNQKDIEVIRTLEAAAALLEVSRERVRQLIADGTLYAENISTSAVYGKWMISLASIEVYKNSRKPTGWHYRKSRGVKS